MRREFVVRPFEWVPTVLTTGKDIVVEVIPPRPDLEQAADPEGGPTDG